MSRHNKILHIEDSKYFTDEASTSFGKSLDLVTLAEERFTKRLKEKDIPVSVIEDELIIVKKDSLFTANELGYDVAATVEEAYRKILNVDYDIIFFDLALDFVYSEKKKEILKSQFQRANELEGLFLLLSYQYERDSIGQADKYLLTGNGDEESWRGYYDQLLPRKERKIKSKHSETDINWMISLILKYYS